MPRLLLDESRIHPDIRERIATLNADLVHEVEAAIVANEIVVIGMAQNPNVHRAKRMLESAKLPFKYLEYGSYLNKWRRRNALKMWSGWPTFPMVFVKGVLIGGADDLNRLLHRGELGGKH
jgi:monothiol glutaredoxin